MPLIQTRDFGEVVCDPSAEFAFPCGIPGFDSEQCFVLIEPTALSPIILLQSSTTPALCFLAIPVSVLEPEYQTGIAPEDLRTLGFDETGQPDSVDEARQFAILSSADDGSFTANLLAPVVLNLRVQRGVQAVRHDLLYSHRHQVPRELLENLCS